MPLTTTTIANALSRVRMPYLMEDRGDAGGHHTRADRAASRRQGSLELVQKANVWREGRFRLSREDVVLP